MLENGKLSSIWQILNFLGHSQISIAFMLEQISVTLPPISISFSSRVKKGLFGTREYDYVIERGFAGVYNTLPDPYSDQAVLLSVRRRSNPDSIYEPVSFGQASSNTDDSNYFSSGKINYLMLSLPPFL